MRIKISGGAERDIEDGCDFYGDIDPNLATTSMTAFLRISTHCYCMQEFTPSRTDGSILSRHGFRSSFGMGS